MENIISIPGLICNGGQRGITGNIVFILFTIAEKDNPADGATFSVPVNSSLSEIKEKKKEVESRFDQ